MDANVMLKAMLEFLGVVTIVAGGIKAIMYFASPFRETKETLISHKKVIDEHTKLIKEQQEAIEELTELTKDVLKTQLSLLNHMIDGNGYEDMKQLRNELQEKL